MWLKKRIICTTFSFLANGITVCIESEPKLFAPRRHQNKDRRILQAAHDITQYPIYMRTTCLTLK
jgi:hypothetical protein